MNYPPFFKVNQLFPDTSLRDIPGEVKKRFADFNPRGKIKPGDSVAVGVASRGTHDLKDLVITTVHCLQELGLKPYIIPAMGSHGGATGEGQAEVLAGLGITPESTGVPVKATMDVVSLGRVENGPEVFVAKDAVEADHLVVINRIKPHTVFRADVESGLCKILAVGLGRQVGASNIHKYKLGESIVPAARLILEKLPVLCGLAVTENALGGTHSLRLALPDEFVDVDRELLKEAWTIFPRLPIDNLDVIILDEMGKDVSGAGMDPNVIGFWRREGGERKPDYNILVVLDITEASHGNATGVGMADIITTRMKNKLDLQATYMNALTSRVIRAARLPLDRPNDQMAIETAFDTVADVSRIKAARIVNTGQLETFWVTRPVLEALEGQDNLTIDDAPLSLEFDGDGRLKPFV